MAGNDVRIHNTPVQRIDRPAERIINRTRTAKSFDVGGEGARVEERYEAPRKFRDDVRPEIGDEQWLRQRTVEELKAVIQAIQLGVTDPWQLTDLIFYARHPEMKGIPMTAEHRDLLDEWNSISALLVHPTLNEIKDVIGAENINDLVNSRADLDRAFANASHFKINAGSLDNYTTRYDSIIAEAVEFCPGLSPAVLKSLLAQESNFHPTVINSYGYAGIAQFGRPAAREVGLNVGVAGSASDERLDPAKAIPAAARLLNIKAKRLGELAFSRYGQPDGIDFWKFVTAAYNGGEGTISLAMGNAYRIGLSNARAQGLFGVEAVSYARRYASKWENLKIGGADSPLGLAAARYFPNIATQKFHEIGNYPTQIVARVAGTFQ
jgi:hypothetical protein